MTAPELPTGDPVAGAAGCAPDGRVLEGTGVRLTPLSGIGDISAELFSCSHGEGASSVWTYMGYGPFTDARAMAEWLEVQARGEDPLFYAVFDRGRGRHVGMTSFVNIAPELRRLEIGHIWLAPEVHRTKLATEVAYLMLRHGFEDLAMRRIEWKCDSLNAASRRAAIRLGFEFEGIFRKHLIVKGRNRDTAWYSMLDDEWSAVGKALRSWLESDGKAPLAGFFPSSG